MPVSHTYTHARAHMQSLSGALRVPFSSPGCGGPSTGGWGHSPLRMGLPYPLHCLHPSPPASGPWCLLKKMGYVLGVAAPWPGECGHGLLLFPPSPGPEVSKLNPELVGSLPCVAMCAQHPHIPTRDAGNMLGPRPPATELVSERWCIGSPVCSQDNVPLQSPKPSVSQTRWNSNPDCVSLEMVPP